MFRPRSDWFGATGVLVHHYSALLFDEDNGQGNDIDGSGSNDDDDDDDDDDLNSLMDRGLEEIDDLLSTKGRLSVFGPPQAPLQGGVGKPGDHRPSPAAGRQGPDRSDPSVTANKDTTAAARGTGANAASVILSGTAPTGPAGPNPTNRELGRRPAEMNGDEATRPRNEGIRSYVYQAGGLHGGGGGGGGVIADHLYSPPRRREKEAATPFIKAKGLILTHAQAKLFGLAGTSAAVPPAVGIARSDAFKPNVTWPGSRSKTQTTGGVTSRRASGLPGGSAREGRRRQQQMNPRRTYSPSRMEQLSNPVPGRGRYGDRRREGDGRRDGAGACKAPPFTWKRSRKAEAAMRYVRELRVA